MLYFGKSYYPSDWIVEVTGHIHILGSGFCFAVAAFIS